MPLLEARHLTKSFGTAQAVHGISFSVEAGRCVALLGPNGAGKTTTLKMLAGLIQPTEGVILFDGKEVSDIRPHLGYLTQNPGFHQWMTGLEFLVYVARLAGLKSSEAMERARETLNRLGLEAAAKRPIRGYSGGMKQRLGICQALIHQPRLLILDEPVSALDPVGRREILGLLAEIRTETTVLYSTHVLHDAEEISDDVIIMVGGKIVLAGAQRDIRQRNQRPKIEISAAISLEPFHEFFAALPGVQNVGGIGSHLSMTARDVPLAREAIFQTILREHIPVDEVHFGQTTLEDLFMEAVQS